MSSSRADTPWTQTATRSTFITELRIVRLPWRGPACALCLSGWMLTEVANDDNARRIYEVLLGHLPVPFWLQASSSEPCVHDQASYIQGLFRLRAGIRFADVACAHSARSLPKLWRGSESSSCSLKVCALAA